MRVGVLEWASCVGPKKSMSLDDSIRREGWAMCSTALTSLARAGHQAVAVVKAELASSLPVQDWPADQLQLVAPPDQSHKRTWKEVYATCDATLVIAPESNHILQDTLAWCSKHRLRTCNAQGDFLTNAADKLATHSKWLSHDIPHPPTRLLSRADRRWVKQLQDDLFASTGREPLWVLKPRYGVGCEGIMRVTAGKIAGLRKGDRRIGKVAGSLVQPWLRGKAYSRAAIVDDAGNPHWLPVTTQRLSVTDSVHYCGGTVEPATADQMPGLDSLLTRAVRALGTGARGWVGVDFIYDAEHASQPITIIEVNPRLTTSFVGLCAAGAPDLAAQIVAACLGLGVHLPGDWQEIEFTAC